MNHQKTIFDRIGDHIVKHSREIGLATLFIAAVGAGFGGYSWYKARLSRDAHKAYAKAAALVSARVVGKDESKGIFETAFTSKREKWEAVARAFGEVYAKNSSIGIGVMAGAAQVNALLKLNKKDEAKRVLSLLVNDIPSPALHALYKMTYALMLVDSDAAGEHTRGINMLKAMARDGNSPVQDSALYHLGNYYWHAKNSEQARNYWKQLVMTFEKETKHPSSWVEKAQKKLAMIDEQQEQG